jgi:hypothetical protein
MLTSLISECVGSGGIVTKMKNLRDLLPVGRLDVVSLAMFLPHPHIHNELTCD